MTPHSIDDGLRDPVSLPRGLTAHTECIRDGAPGPMLGPCGSDEPIALRLEAVDLLADFFEEHKGLGAKRLVGHGSSTIGSVASWCQPRLTTGRQGPRSTP